VGEGTSPQRPAVLAARADVLAARGALGEELVRLEASARAAVDVKAKIRRSPVKAAGLVGGAAFLVVKGPRRVFRGVRRAVMGPEEPLPPSLLPKEIDAALKKIGSDGEQVRGVLEREFASYLEATEQGRKTRNLRGAFTVASLALLRPLVLAYGKKLSKDIFETEGPAYQTQLERVRERMAEATGKKQA